MPVATPSLSLQNWYSDSLAAGCGSGDNTLQLNNLPVPTEGYLILDPNNVSSREVIHYTGKTSSTVTGVTRGVDGTTPQAHAQNTTVVMNYTSSHFLALQDGSAQTAVHAEVLSNPYKFGVYLNSAQNLAAGGNVWTKIAYDTKEFDTSTNIDVVTNHRFTAPIAGFYQINATMQVTVAASTDTFAIAIYKNGTELKRGNMGPGAAGSITLNQYVISAIVQLAANDYLEIFGFNSVNATRAVTTGANNTYFQGFLVSKT